MIKTKSMTIPREFPEKFKKLPLSIQKIMLSPETAEINGKIGEKYKLSDEKIGDMVNVIVQTILKEIPLERFVIALQQKLELDAQTARQTALDIAEKRFLPIKNHLPGIEKLIQNLGGKPIDQNIVDLKNQ